MKRGWTYAVAATLLGLLAGCEGRGHYSSVPDAFVYIQVNVPVYYPHLNGIGFSECFTKDSINVTQQNRDNWVQATGYGGVLVYAAPSANPDNLSGVEYQAYDMCCPNELDPDVRVWPDSTGIYAVCEQCGSRFDLSSYGMAAWKDTLFSAAAVLLAMQVWQAGVRGESPRQAAAFFLTLLFICFWRNNGIYVAAPAANTSAAVTVSIASHEATITGSGTIMYTDDGSDPRYSTSAKKYDNGTKPTTTKGTIIRAYQVETGKLASPVAEDVDEDE